MKVYPYPRSATAFGVPELSVLNSFIRVIRCTQFVIRCTNSFIHVKFDVLIRSFIHVKFDVLIRLST
jgi:hypothetical protein